MRPKSPTAIQELLKETLSHFTHHSPLKKHGFLENWELIVGDSLAKTIQPIEYNEKTLTIGAPSSSWINELNFHIPLILKKIHQILPHTPVEKIRFQLLPLDNLLEIRQREKI